MLGDGGAVRRVQLQEGLRMVAGVRVHAVDHAKFVRVLGGLGQQFGNPEAAVAVSLEIKYRTRMRRLRDLRFIVEVSRCAGPPDMHRKITRLARAGSGRGLGASGLAVFPCAVSVSNADIARYPKPHEAFCSMSRRLISVANFISIQSIDMRKFVCI